MAVSFFHCGHSCFTMVIVYNPGDWWQFFTCASGQLTPSCSHVSTVPPTPGAPASNPQGTGGVASMSALSQHQGSPSLTDTIGGSIDVTALGNQNVFLRCLPAAAAASTAGGSGMKNAFVIVQITRFQQVIGVFTLQAPTEALKVVHMMMLLVFSPTLLPNKSIITASPATLRFHLLVACKQVNVNKLMGEV